LPGLAAVTYREARLRIKPGSSGATARVRLLAQAPSARRLPGRRVRVC